MNISENIFFSFGLIIRKLNSKFYLIVLPDRILNSILNVDGMKAKAWFQIYLPLKGKGRENYAVSTYFLN